MLQISIAKINSVIMIKNNHVVILVFYLFTPQCETWSHSVAWKLNVCISLCCLGETVLPQAQCSVGPAGSVRWHPQAVELRWADQSPGAAEAPQPALPHQGSTQRARVQVTECKSLATLQLIHYQCGSKNQCITPVVRCVSHLDFEHQASLKKMGCKMAANQEQNPYYLICIFIYLRNNLRVGKSSYFYCAASIYFNWLFFFFFSHLALMANVALV